MRIKEGVQIDWQSQVSRRNALKLGVAAFAVFMQKPSGVSGQDAAIPSPAPAPAPELTLAPGPIPSLTPGPEPSLVPSPEVVDNSQWTRLKVLTLEDLQQDRWQMAKWGSVSPRVPKDRVVNEVLASQYEPTDAVLDASGTQFFPEEVDIDNPKHALSEGRNMVFPYRSNLTDEGFGTVYIPVEGGQAVNVEIYTEGLPARYRLIPAELFPGSTVNGYYLQIDGTGNASRQAQRSGFESIDGTPIPKTDRVEDEYVLRGRSRRDILVHINVRTIAP